MAEEISIAPARPADAEDAATIVVGAFDGVGVDELIEDLLGRAGEPTWQDLKARQVRGEVQRTPDDCFLARAAGRVVGCVTCRVNVEISRGYILNLAVEEPFRGRGIGRPHLGPGRSMASRVRAAAFSWDSVAQSYQEMFVRLGRAAFCEGRQEDQNTCLASGDT